MANISAIKVGSTTYGIAAELTAHASSSTTYGIGSDSKYGHVKLSDKYDRSAGTANSGVGASSAAVYNAYTELRLGKVNCAHGIALGGGRIVEIHAELVSPESHCLFMLTWVSHKTLRMGCEIFYAGGRSSVLSGYSILSDGSGVICRHAPESNKTRYYYSFALQPDYIHEILIFYSNHVVINTIN